MWLLPSAKTSFVWRIACLLLQGTVERLACQHEWQSCCVPSSNVEEITTVAPPASTQAVQLTSGKEVCQFVHSNHVMMINYFIMVWLHKCSSHFTQKQDMLRRWCLYVSFICYSALWILTQLCLSTFYDFRITILIINYLLFNCQNLQTWQRL